MMHYAYDGVLGVVAVNNVRKDSTSLKRSPHRLGDLASMPPSWRGTTRIECLHDFNRRLHYLSILQVIPVT